MSVLVQMITECIVPYLPSVCTYSVVEANDVQMDTKCKTTTH